MTDTPTRVFDVRVTDHGGRLLLVRGREAFELDDVAALIWSKCDGRTKEDEIVATVAEEYAVDERTAREDLQGFVAELRTKGLLE
jgi:pyrroloquinoline quinone biosynthesis protein D